MSSDAGLLRALASGQPRSGEQLGAELGISRAAVWKAVQRLRALGVEVESLPRRGYRLPAPLELLDAAAIRAALPATLAAGLAAIEVHDAIDSTNARVLAAAPTGRLLACLAEHQSAGRGRRGRSWYAAPGAGLCLSVGGRLAAAPADFAALAPMVGAACAATLAALGAPEIRLKWPNDLLLGDGKLGGILVELRGEAQGPVTLAVGVGINLRLGAATRAAILAGGGLAPADLSAHRIPGRNLLAAALVAAIAGCLAAPALTLSESARATWRERDALRDRPVRIEGAGAGLEGRARGLDDAGALLLETEIGIRRVTAGEVSVRVAP